MTAYFDRIDSEIHATRSLPEWKKASALEKIERRLVHDVTIAVELPGFDEDLREAVHRVVMRYGVATLPINAPRADFEFNDEYGQRLASMASDLHTIFHGWCSRNLAEHSDDPRARLQAFYVQGEERREGMVTTRPSPLTSMKHDAGE